MKKRISLLLVIIMALSLSACSGAFKNCYENSIFSLYDTAYPIDYSNSVWVTEQNQYAHIVMTVDAFNEATSVLTARGVTKNYKHKFVSACVYFNDEQVDESLNASFRFWIKDRKPKNGKWTVYIDKKEFYKTLFGEDLLVEEDIYFTFVLQQNS